ncbi:MAG: hypothetical protein KKG47_02340 [Proteobacteria bacterium]|nr:hypothetical protein [Pseudomonadota bacterium]MBU1737418.1 hypothetical protein [Pseudomonadota bacterium]
MSKNTIIELTPFRADLTRALARRGERLLASSDLASEVAALEPLEAYYIIREIGLDQALPVLLELNKEQLEACIDLDCWNRYDFAPDSLDQWMTAYSQGGAESLAKAFYSLNFVEQLLFLTKTITVYDPDIDEVPLEDEEESERPRVMTPDGFFLLEAKEGPALKIHPFTVLDALYRYDPDSAHHLLRQVRVDLPTQIEEEALRFRTGRMEDLGFSAPDEAAVLFSRPADREAGPQHRELFDSKVARLPSLYAAPLSESSLLEQALSLITDHDALSRLEQEIVWTINSAVIAYGETTKEIEQIVDIAERVRDTISLGLQILLAAEDPPCPPDSAEAPARASALLDVWCVTDLFRHGFAATIGLQQEVRQAMAEPLFLAWYEMPDAEQSDEPEDRNDRAFVAALQGHHPLRSGFDPQKIERVMAFASPDEIEAASLRLRKLVEQICGS